MAGRLEDVVNIGPALAHGRDTTARIAPFFIEREGGCPFEDFGLIVEDGDAVLEEFLQSAAPGVMRDEPLRARLVAHHGEAEEPDDAFLALQRAHLLGEAIRPGEVMEIHALLRCQPAFAGQFGPGAGRAKIAQRIGHAHGVAPQPEDASVVDDGLHGILSDDATIGQRFGERRLFPE